MMLVVLLQILAPVVALIIVARLSSSSSRREWAQRVDRLLTICAARPRVAVLAAGLLAAALASAAAAWRWPLPAVHDEFSYLLAADTFASCRLTNPPHPLWEHFESFHIIQQPTYASKFPPAQGAFLALGLALTGSPITGIWLATALAAGSACWMAQGCFHGKWSLLAGVFVAAHPTLQFAWAQSFWGGTVSVIGAALVLGGFFRLRRTPDIRNSVLMCIGVLLLANHRPYEGAVFCSVVAVALALQFVSLPKSERTAVVTRIVAPSIVVLGIGATFMGYYNFRVTGHPLRMPYQVHEAEYGVSPLFLWGTPNPVPEYRHPVVREFYLGWGMDAWKKQRTAKGIGAEFLLMLLYMIQFVVTPSLVVPIGIALWWPIPARSRWPALAITVCILGSSAVVWKFPHYYGCVLVLGLVLAIIGLRRLTVWMKASAHIRTILVPTLLVWYLLQTAMLLGGIAIRSRLPNAQPEPREQFAMDRARIASLLEETPGKHLVIVRYGPDHNSHCEWVYNRADIDQAKLVWAREMSPDHNSRLTDYFQDHSIWLLEADMTPPRLSAFPALE